MPTSFICEHSAEFFLVPYMKSLLEKEFKQVVPIFPWLSRELGSKSKKIHKDAKFYVLVLFPRRPKTSGDNKLFVTLNDELNAFKKIGDKHGITVIAGCPKVTDFWELADREEHVWMKIGYSDTGNYLLPFDSLVSGPDTSLLSDDEILSSVRAGEQHTMESLESFIRYSRCTQSSTFFGARYKPVYFLMKIQ